MSLSPSHTMRSSGGADTATFGTGEGPDAELRMDLKGVIYSAALVPSACTMAVVNISGSDARVEALTSSFMQLTREAGGANGNGGEDGDNHFMWDDDDNYQVNLLWSLLVSACSCMPHLRLVHDEVASLSEMISSCVMALCCFVEAGKQQHCIVLCLLCCRGRFGFIRCWPCGHGPIELWNAYCMCA